jgi:hypothetical protein
VSQTPVVAQPVKERITQIPLLLKWHPKEFGTETVWNIDDETPIDVRIVKVNRRSQVPLLNIDSFEELRIFLMRNGLNVANQQIQTVIDEAVQKYGVGNGIWLNCTRLDWSLHGLSRHFDIRDSLLIQNQSECDDAEDGMFTTKRKLLNTYWEETDSPLRFIKSYTVRRPI